MVNWKKLGTRFLEDIYFATLNAGLPLFLVYLMTKALLKNFNKPGASDAKNLLLHPSITKYIQENKIELNSYEKLLLEDIVSPTESDVDMDQIGGLQKIKHEILQTVIKPLQTDQKFGISRKKHSLLKPVRGVLLHGPPGTGKTLLAKAVAREAGCFFINMQREKLKHFYLGESEKLMAALFSLAKKFQPCIIFIDEIETFLRSRGDSFSHEVSTNQLSIFLSLFDGFSSDASDQIVVIGATNRIYALDEAALRRLPLQLHVDLPTESERQEILQLLLREEVIDPKLDLKYIANKTDKYSGSDLKELCRRALLSTIDHQNGTNRQVNMKDFENALTIIKSTATQAASQQKANSALPFFVNYS